MGLFSKKGPCVLCGGKVSALFPWKIEGQYVCNNCHGVLDIPEERQNNLTMDEFLAYRAFREENEKLREGFVVSERIDFGFWDTKIVFDFEHRLFCMSKNLDKTIFRGSELRSFVIREDDAPLFEGDATGLRHYESFVPGRVMELMPRIAQFTMQMQMHREMERQTQRMQSRDGSQPRPPRPFFDIPEPFRAFNIELRFDHPYWGYIECDMKGPEFNNDFPDVNDYLRDYQNDIKELEVLVHALMTVAFPNAGEVGQKAPETPEPPAAPAPQTDTVEELKRYKALLDDGIITPEEFTAKKKQLLGI